MYFATGAFSLRTGKGSTLKSHNNKDIESFSLVGNMFAYKSLALASVPLNLTAQKDSVG